MDSLERFVPEYFDQNPLSNLGVLALRDSRCEKLSELSGDRSRHVSTVCSLIIFISCPPSSLPPTHTYIHSLHLFFSHLSFLSLIFASLCLFRNPHFHPPPWYCLITGRLRQVDVCKGARYKPSGEVSLQNMLTVAVRSLKSVGHRTEAATQ